MIISNKYIGKIYPNKILCKILHIFPTMHQNNVIVKRAKVHSDIKTERFLIINRVNFPTIIFSLHIIYDIVFSNTSTIRYAKNFFPFAGKHNFSRLYVLSGSFTRKHVKILTRVSLNKTLVWAENIPGISRTAEKENSVSGGIIFVFAFCPARMQFSSTEHTHG